MGDKARWSILGESVGSTSVSVVLATFNGDRFLPELVSSLAGRTGPPDGLTTVGEG